jgi:hypothetical protein
MMSRSQERYVYAGLTALIVATMSVARSNAAPWKPKAARAVDLIRAGQDAYDAGEYVRAAGLFLQSWDVETAHLARWNAGQSFAAAGDWRRALYLFERLLDDQTLPAKERPNVEARRQVATAFLAAQDAARGGELDEARAAYLEILADKDLNSRDRKHASDALDALAQTRAAPAPMPASEPSSAPSAPVTAAATVMPPVSAPVSPSPLLVPRDSLAATSRWSDTTAWVLLGGGVAVGALGVSLAWHAGSLENEAKAGETPEPDRPGLLDRAAGERSASRVAYVAGAALLVGGAIKLAVPPSSPQVMASVVPAREGGLVVLSGRF